MKKLMALVTGVALTVGCGSSGEDYVNLDGVMDAFVATASAMESAMPAPELKVEVAEDASEAEVAAAMQKAAEAAAAPSEPNPEQEANAEVENAFLTTFAANLNRSSEAVGYGKPLGVKFADDGSFKGFADENLNNKQDAGEVDVFKLEIDWERERLIASDLQHDGYHRDHSYRRSHMGFFGGYMVGRMLGGQRRAGIGGGRYSSMNMKPRGYHKSVSGARRYGSSARSSGGSRGYRGGK